jgi:acetylornithine/N-succinyldiaminopimelate aminotransferase
LIGCALTEPWQGKAREFLQASQDEGVFVLVAGASVLRLAPSLIISQDDIDEGLKRLERAIAVVCAGKA